MNVYHGGTAPVGQDVHLYIDNVVIADQYIGPMAPSMLILNGLPDDQAAHLIWTVNTALPGTATWQIEYDGPPGDQPSPIVQPDPTTRSTSLTGLTNYETYTITLQAIDAGSAILTDTIRLMPSNWLLYLANIRN